MNDFDKWQKDYIEHLQPRSEMLVNAGELTQRRMKAAWLAGQAVANEEIAILRKSLDDLGVTPSGAKADAIRASRRIGENKWLRKALAEIVNAETWNNNSGYMVEIAKKALEEK